jgi:hypothetical protein
MAGVKGRSGRLTKIEENYGRNLGLKGLQLLSDYVNDPDVSREDKLTRLQPYLVKMLPETIRLESQSEDTPNLIAVALTLKALANGQT